MKRIAFVGASGQEKQRFLMLCRGITLSPEKRRLWNLMIRVILILQVNILAIPACITP